jgi:hypothetical protein
MPFLGKQPPSGFSSYTKQDLTADGSTTGFTLNKNVASANDVEVFVGNVRQEPTDAYSVSGNTLTMTAAPSSGTNFYVLFKEATQSTTVPAAGTTVPGTFEVQSTFTAGEINSLDRDGSGRGIKLDTQTDDTKLRIRSQGGNYRRITFEDITDTPTKYNFQVAVQEINDALWMGPSTAIGGSSYSSTNGVGINNTGVLMAGQGITLGNGVTYSAANTLDDYEEGNWTPVLTFGGGDTGITYNTGAGGAAGQYVRIGQMVWLWFNIYLSNKGSSTGDVLITGAPFNAANTFYNENGGSLHDWINFSGVRSFISTYFDSLERIQLRHTNFNSGSMTGMQNINNSNLTNSSFFRGFVCYRTND